jgi:3'-phosphoadenosine 5'-phosphosulfate sulfotransferase (PAPS reductase)/FAD synthetase
MAEDTSQAEPSQGVNAPIEYVVKSSYGNDSLALLVFCYEQKLQNVHVLYNDTGWASKVWEPRVALAEDWVRRLGFTPHRTQSEGFQNLVRRKKSFPRQGIQFCTQELKLKPTFAWHEKHDPYYMAVSVIGVRREESANRAAFPEFSVSLEGGTIWAPLVNFTTAERNELLEKAGVEPLPHRSEECYPCINANRADLLGLSEDRIAEIEVFEKEMGYTSLGKPRTMYRPYRYMGATGIREIVRWAKSPRGKFDLDDGNGVPGCEAGYCGG